MENQYEKLKENKYENLGWSLLGIAYVASMIAALAAGTINSPSDSKNIEKWMKPMARVSKVEAIAQDEKNCNIAAIEANSEE